MSYVVTQLLMILPDTLHAVIFYDTTGLVPKAPFIASS